MKLAIAALAILVVLELAVIKSYSQEIRPSAGTADRPAEAITRGLPVDDCGSPGSWYVCSP